MKIFTMLMLSLIIGACSNSDNKDADRMSRDTLTREPIIYRDYIEEGGEEYLDKHRTDADNMYYRGYSK